MVLKFPKSKNVGTDRDIATYFLSDGRALCYIYIPTSVNEGSLENSTKPIGMYRHTVRAIHHLRPIKFSRSHLIL